MWCCVELFYVEVGDVVVWCVYSYYFDGAVG